MLNNKDMVVPVEAMWLTQVDNKWAWGTIIKKQPGGNGQQRTGHLTPTEADVKWGIWKSLLKNLYLEGATRNHKGYNEAYKYASRNALGGILVFACFFYSDT
jgi:hypothetical protein